MLKQFTKIHSTIVHLLLQGRSQFTITLKRMINSCAAEVNDPYCQRDQKDIEFKSCSRLNPHL